MSDGFVKEYKLRQITPIIHFQHDNENNNGAVLRASEVKPKLDRFIIESLGEDNLDKCFFINGTKALDYKMKIILENGAGNEKFNNKPRSYFEIRNEQASNGNGRKVVISGLPIKNFQKGKYNPKYIFIYIICYNKELQSIINNHIEVFFIVTNFGFRQNMGFGGYEVVRKKSLNKQDEIIKYAKKFNKRVIRFDFKYDIVSEVGSVVSENKSQKIKRFMDSLYTFHKNLKSDYIYNYVAKNNWFTENNYKEGEYNDGKEQIFVKGLFGLPPFIGEFGSIIVKSNNKNIERIPSPITYKVFIDSKLDIASSKRIYKASGYAIIDIDKLVYGCEVMLNDQTFKIPNTSQFVVLDFLKELFEENKFKYNTEGMYVERILRII